MISIVHCILEFGTENFLRFIQVYGTFLYNSTTSTLYSNITFAWLIPNYHYPVYNRDKFKIYKCHSMHLMTKYVYPNHNEIIDWQSCPTAGNITLLSIVFFYFLHDRPWISLWIKSISNELDITIHLSIVLSLWRHQQSIVTSSAEWRSSVLSSFRDTLCGVTNKMMYVLSWRTCYALTRVLFWCSFPSLLGNSGNKHQNNPLVSA